MADATTTPESTYQHAVNVTLSLSACGIRRSAQQSVKEMLPSCANCTCLADCRVRLWLQEQHSAAAGIFWLQGHSCASRLPGTEGLGSAARWHLPQQWPGKPSVNSCQDTIIHIDMTVTALSANASYLLRVSSFSLERQHASTQQDLQSAATVHSVVTDLNCCNPHGRCPVLAALTFDMLL